MQLYDEVVITEDLPDLRVSAGTGGTWVDSVVAEDGTVGYAIELAQGHAAGTVVIIPKEAIAPSPDKKRRVS